MKKSTSSSTIAVAIFTIITILAWIGFDLYHIRVTSTIPAVVEEIIVPLDPALDTETINLIKTKVDFADFATGQKTATPSALTSPTPQLIEPTPTSTSSAQLNL